jgi:hypothetical protein
VRGIHRAEVSRRYVRLPTANDENSPEHPFHPQDIIFYACQLLAVD